MPEYQHFVPSFILRKFTNYKKPALEDYPAGEAGRKAWSKAKSKANSKVRVSFLSFEDEFDRETLGDVLNSKVFGIPDLYDKKVERDLSTLEQAASNIIDEIERDFSSGMPSTTITRKKINTLWKFLFILFYRHRMLRDIFVGGMEGWSLDDRRRLRDYMVEKGFTSPKDVWLSNIQAFMRVELGPDTGLWVRWLMEHAFPDHAAYFIWNMTTYHLCFCSPTEADAEFILTQNAYGVYEGPSSPAGYNMWHLFAPISDKVIIVLRENCLSKDSDAGLEKEARIVLKEFALGQSVRSLHSMSTAESGRSLLANLPVSRAIQSYSVTEPQEEILTFEFYDISSDFVQLINSFFLEAAIETDTIIYKSKDALRKSLEAYLEVELSGFKLVMDDSMAPADGDLLYDDATGLKLMKDGPWCKREDYLKMLERIARDLGSGSSAKFERSSPQKLLCLPDFSEAFAAKYRLLGYNDAVDTWFQDINKAYQKTALWTRQIHKASKMPQSNTAEEDIEQARLHTIRELIPRQAWLTLRTWRATLRFLEFGEDFSVLAVLPVVVSENIAGPEDTIVDARALFRPDSVSRAMLGASVMGEYAEECVKTLEPPLNTEFFTAAKRYVGSIRNCGIAALEEAACKALEDTKPNFRMFAALKALPEDVVLEMWVNRQVHDNFEQILEGCSLQQDVLRRLKMVFFELLYPLRTEGRYERLLQE